MTNPPLSPQGTTPPAFESVVLRGKRLFATAQGKDYPLYVYAPLAQMYAERRDVPLCDQWQPYDRGFVEQYVPLPNVTSLPPGPGADFGVQTRAQGTKYPGAQQVFRNWPLYYVPNLTGDVAQSAAPSMFVPATTDLTRLVPGPAQPKTDDPGVLSYPPPCLGP